MTLVVAFIMRNFNVKLISVQFTKPDQTRFNGRDTTTKKNEIIEATGVNCDLKRARNHKRK